MTDPNTVSTGVPPLDAALGGLFWGDNVVWELDEGGQVALDAAPGQQDWVLGELAGLARSGQKSTLVKEFMAGLPSPLVCSAKVVSQHAYAGGVDPVDAVQKSVNAHGCATQPRVWITETGPALRPLTCPPRRSQPAAARRVSR